MKGLLFGWKYALAAIALAVVAMLIMEFNSRMGEWRRLSVQQEQVAITATGLAKTQDYLLTEIAHSTSPAGVQDWTYSEGRWVKSDEILVVPLPQGVSTPVPTPVPTVTPQVVSNWELWLSLFFSR
jgi:hypothetical protein